MTPAERALLLHVAATQVQYIQHGPTGCAFSAARTTQKMIDEIEGARQAQGEAAELTARRIIWDTAYDAPIGSSKWFALLYEAVHSALTAQAAEIERLRDMAHPELRIMGAATALGDKLPLHITVARHDGKPFDTVTYVRQASAALSGSESNAG